jgi:UDP-GlcNAc:undecaprenyl-phosphate GlcNAc-1-phosphate transferase
MHIGIVAASAFLICAALIAALRPLAHRIGLVDRPNARKAHLGDIPLVGGLGIVGSFVLAALLFGAAPAPSVGFLAAGLVLALGGLLDDFYEVPAFVKLTFQIAGILLMCFLGGTVVYSLGALIPGLGAIELGLLAVPFTLIGAVGLINAVNLSDGLDGLAGLQMVVAFTALAFLAERGGAVASDELLVLIGCVGGFLFFNARVLGRRKASVFMGDTGTMFLGFAYVWFAIRLSGGDRAVMSPVTALWLLAMPILDTVTMIIRRVSRGRSPFKADKEHLHHVFLMAGFTVGETVMIFTGMAVVTASIGIAGDVFGVSEATMLAAFIAAAALYLWIVLRAWSVMRFLRWSICRRRAMQDRRKNSERRKDRQAALAWSHAERRQGGDRRQAPRRAEDSGSWSEIRGDVREIVPRERAAGPPAPTPSDEHGDDGAPYRRGAAGR